MHIDENFRNCGREDDGPARSPARAHLYFRDGVGAPV